MHSEGSENGTPAPVLYTSANQVGVIAPFALNGSNAQVAVLYNGQPVIVRFDLAANPPVFDKGYFTSLACVAEVARP